ncbi:MAG: hypothetical protein FJW30_20130 [Acidobacteria bacterium]|nr:hypothetical protein [Acidobacteriota bacterium]
MQREIVRVQKVFALTLVRDTKKEWAFFRKGAEEVLWAKVDAEYRAEAAVKVASSCSTRRRVWRATR